MVNKLAYIRVDIGSTSAFLHVYNLKVLFADKFNENDDETMIIDDDDDGSVVNQIMVYRE